MSNPHILWPTNLRSIRYYIARSDHESRFGLRFTEWCVLVITAVLCSFAAGFAADSCSNGVCVAQAWARATPPGSDNAAVYFSMTNKGSGADALFGAQTPAAAHAMLHQTMTKGGMAQMDMVKSVAVPAGATVTFAPVGYHVMLTGLKAPLREGATVPFALQFAKAGKIDVLVHVLSTTAIGPEQTQVSSGTGMPNVRH